MADCKNITHPFLTDPGISQHQRIAENLLSGPAKIDARSLADLLDFFVRLSAHIKYYDEHMEVSDWKPFFDKSLPFTLAGIIKYDDTAISNTLNKYKIAFEKKPSTYGLQLLLNYVYHQYISRINQWEIQLKGSSLNTEQLIERLIKDKAKNPVKKFMKLANTATKWYCTTNFNFTPLLENPAWDLKHADIYGQDETAKKGAQKRKKLLELYDQVIQAATVFPVLIRAIGTSAEMNLEQSLLPLNEELKQKTPPHLAVLFAFLKMFRTIQGDLNNFTKNHLDYFYKQVLHLQPKNAVADKVHVVAEIQKQLDKYLLKKGTLLKGGKDLNKEEILFALDDEIVVNKTQVAEQRTLFLNNILIDQDTTFLEGVYIAPDATKANGIDKDFKDVTFPSHATLGSKWSKYIDSENKFIYPYPNARLGFILASPVLLLNEGNRKIKITLDCEFEDRCSMSHDPVNTNKSCCDESEGDGASDNENETKNLIDIPADMFNKISTIIGSTYYQVSRPLIAAAVKKGVSKALENKFNNLLIIEHDRDHDDEICYCPKQEKKFDKLIPKGDFDVIVGNEAESIKDIFIPQRAFNIFFSGEKTWIPAPADTTIEIKGVENKFSIQIIATLTPDVPAVTFYNSETLKENLNTTLPLVKIELNDSIKIIQNITDSGKKECCERPMEQKEQPVSLYHFFRNVTLQDSTRIDVKVCGVKQLIVQNDESLQDVNAPIFAFGTRPKVGASFYIGSKELFSKNWQNFNVNAEWKDRPTNFETHYAQYGYADFTFEDGSSKVVESSFGIKESVLNNGEWVQHHFPPATGFDSETRRLFKHLDKDKDTGKEIENVSDKKKLKFYEREATKSLCDDSTLSLNFNEDSYDYARNEFFKDKPKDPIIYQRLPYIQSPLLPLNVSSRYGFIRLSLEGLNFLYDEYPFVLARQMMAYAKMVSPTTIGPVILTAREASALAVILRERLTNIRSNIDKLVNTSFPGLIGNIDSLLKTIKLLYGSITTLPKTIEHISTDVESLSINIGKIKTQWNDLNTNLNQPTDGLNDLLIDLSKHMTTILLLNLDIPADLATAKTELALANTTLNKITTQIGKINTNFGAINLLIPSLSTIDGIKMNVTTIQGTVGKEGVGKAIGTGLIGMVEAIQKTSEAIRTAVVDDIQKDIGDILTDLKKEFPATKKLEVLSGKGTVEDPFVFKNIGDFGIMRLAEEIETRINSIIESLTSNSKIIDGLPKEPYTPVIKSLSLDYTATADKADIDLIHLYPYAGTFKAESLPTAPSLLPTFCDEGNLFIGLKDLVPGSNLNILFQLAEATADSEALPEPIKWYYLENNTWKLLRNSFEILDDDTNGLTTSGIIKFALPANMTNENTILPKGLHWIKASVTKNSTAISEVISVHTQAVKATFTNTVENDRARLTTALPAGSVAKLEQADASVTKLTQPYESFGGMEPEETAHFYVRVSELLRHKNRAIQKFDYERIALEFFPDLFKAKCINHSYFLNAHQFVKDFTVAPGYVMLAVIPDLNRLKAAASFEPKVPVSMLEEITTRLKKLTSPFVRIKVVNPRYEKVNFCMRIKLLPGKDQNYYNEQLKKDVSEFLAPWAVGQFDKLTFGQPINRSDIVRFLEGLDYLDYIIELKMGHADELDEKGEKKKPADQLEVVPLTPRSILVAGNIDVCINQKDCEQWIEPGCENKPYHINDYCKVIAG